MMRKAKNIIFDCDGVLVDSEIIANRIEVEVKNELGFAITLEEQIKKFVGHGLKGDVVQEELKKLPPDFISVVDERCKTAYLSELKPVKGIIDFLKASSHPMCVASSSQIESLKFKLQHTDLIGFFPEAVFSADFVEKPKPEPDLFFYAMEKMNWKSSECILIEDSIAGVTAGKAAGLTVFGFVAGLHILPGHADLLLAAGADYVISDIQKICAFLQD